eukprot:CAMPEP_0206149582 /NCGR_PEP_ID=MMETSP1473-20131121/37858_1 /ASSEMBLY_ACC=CAM_ASM_001109 /TAXON_ID=1461547 /ORGANISM="Stichococcus sp, Strain RCC1054" /LENGTH=135 /DNA_ID=CAMNT_0053547057 /DNA_START=289 /DNA_END=696 /DNA_ORIENTATION=+
MLLDVCADAQVPGHPEQPAPAPLVCGRPGPAAGRFETVVRGVIAGNIFDLGAAAGADMYNSGKMPKFQDTRNNLHPRPWCVDDLDLLLDALTECQGAPFKKAVMFCDNSGSDIIMGTPTCRFNSLFPCSQHMHPS